jgi:release factor glutamine methyltransferase
MVDVLSQMSLTGKRVLDMGTGSGILGVYCAVRGADVTACDIDQSTVSRVGEVASMLGVKLRLIVSDLFSNIQDQFDLIIFNPPYLPSRGVEDRSVDGGANGTRVIEKFLRQIPSHLARRAQALLLVSNLNDPAALQLRHNNFEFSTVAKRSFFFEQLQVLRLRLRDDLSI